MCACGSRRQKREKKLIKNVLLRAFDAALRQMSNVRSIFDAAN